MSLHNIYICKYISTYSISVCTFCIRTVYLLQTLMSVSVALMDANIPVITILGVSLALVILDMP